MKPTSEPGGHSILGRVAFVAIGLLGTLALIYWSTSGRETTRHRTKLSPRPVANRPAEAILYLGCSARKNDHRRELIGRGGWVTVETIDDCLTPWVDATGLKFGTLACVMVQSADIKGKYDWEKVCPRQEHRPRGNFVRFRTIPERDGGATRVTISFVPR